MSHGGGLCVCVVARTRDAVGLGVDLEVLEHLPRDLLGLFADPGEVRYVDVEPSQCCGFPVAALWSVKEAAFKAMEPGACRELSELELAVDVRRQRFRLRSIQGSVDRADRAQVHGSWWIRGGGIVALAWRLGSSLSETPAGRAPTG